MSVSVGFIVCISYLESNFYKDITMHLHDIDLFERILLYFMLCMRKMHRHPSRCPYLDSRILTRYSDPWDLPRREEWFSEPRRG